MDYRKMNDTVYLRIDKREPVIETIKSICKKEQIEAGSFQGIGACDKAVLSTWIPEKKDFIQHKLTGMLEIVLHCAGTKIGRQFNPEAGIDVWDLGCSR